jgi:hypothetical protein
MKGFRQYIAERRMNEALIRKGAVAAYALQGKKHGDNAVRSYNQSKQTLRAAPNSKSANAKIDSLIQAFTALLDGLISQRAQIGAVSAQITTSNI